MSRLIYDEKELVDSQIYKYDKFLHSRINKYTGDARTLVTYFSIDEENTTGSLGLGTHYQVLGPDSPFRYNKIENMVLLGMSPFTPEETTASQTNVRNYSISGECTTIPGTVMPKENDMFIVNYVHMNHIFRINQVTQDGLNTDGSYKIQYSLYSTNPEEICWIDKQVTNHSVMDLQTISGEDLTPVIGKEHYELRSRLISMLYDMIENYEARYYNEMHNCYVLHFGGETWFDLCGNMFMARNATMIMDDRAHNITLNENKIRIREMNELYELSPYKWIERHAPIRYLETFKFYLAPAVAYGDSSFAMYGYDDWQIMIPTHPTCHMSDCKLFFPEDVYKILSNKFDPRTCTLEQCYSCPCCNTCEKTYHQRRYDYISLIHDYIWGQITKMEDLSLYIGDTLFNNVPSREVYLWTPIVIHIIKETLKIK